MTHRIAVIAGDGIGPEGVAEALKVARAAGAELDTTDYDLGARRYELPAVDFPAIQLVQQIGNIRCDDVDYF